MPPVRVGRLYRRPAPNSEPVDTVPGLWNGKAGLAARKRAIDGYLGYGATYSVMVNVSALLVCHQCYCAGSCLAWGSIFRAVLCDIFSGYSGFLPSFFGLMVQPVR